MKPLPDYLAKATTEHARLTLESGRVTRYHAAPTVRSQTLAAHQWGVAIIVLHLTRGECSIQLLTEALVHDTAELETGDTPFSAKRDMPELKDLLDSMERHIRLTSLLVDPILLNEEETAILKLADTLDGFIHCVKEEAGTFIRDRWQESFRLGHFKYATRIRPDILLRARNLFAAHGGDMS